MKQISFCDDDCEIADQRDVANRGQRLHPAADAAALLRNFRARPLRSEAVANPNRSPRGHHRTQRLRMQHLRPEVGQFRGLAVGNFGNGARVGHQARVRGQHAIDVGPDDDLVDAQRRS